MQFIHVTSLLHEPASGKYDAETAQVLVSINPRYIVSYESHIRDWGAQCAITMHDCMMYTVRESPDEITAMLASIQ